MSHNFTIPVDKFSCDHRCSGFFYYPNPIFTHWKSQSVLLNTAISYIVRMEQKKLQSKLGGVEDEMDDDLKEAEEASAVWGRRKDNYHGGDNVDYEVQA